MSNELCTPTSCTPATRVEDQAEATQRVLPRTDIYETPDSFVLRADLPGVDEQGLELRVENRRLYVEGNFSYPGPDGAIRRAATTTRYSRSFQLGDGIDTNRIDAQLRNGVLTVTFAKPEQAQPRRIEVRTA